jgi:hypothetical protein
MAARLAVVASLVGLALVAAPAAAPRIVVHTVNFQSGSRATSLRTSSTRERTARGVGPGSTEAQLRARVAGVRCRTESGFRHCWVGRFLPGRVVTDFRIRRGRVASVLVGYVLD